MELKSRSEPRVYPANCQPSASSLLSSVKSCRSNLDSYSPANDFQAATTISRLRAENVASSRKSPWYPLILTNPLLRYQLIPKILRYTCCYMSICENFSTNDRSR